MLTRKMEAVTYLQDEIICGIFTKLFKVTLQTALFLKVCKPIKYWLICALKTINVLNFISGTQTSN